MRVVRVTLAVDDLDRMTSFYNTCFRCDLTPSSGSPLVSGSLAGIEFQLCPNSVAAVVAEQSRHQLRVAVEDPERVAAAIASAGGQIVDRSGRDTSLVIGVADPEGNTMELVAERTHSQP